MEGRLCIPRDANILEKDLGEKIEFCVRRFSNRDNSERICNLRGGGYLKKVWIFPTDIKNIQRINSFCFSIVVFLFWNNWTSSRRNNYLTIRRKIFLRKRLHQSKEIELQFDFSARVSTIIPPIGIITKQQNGRINTKRMEAVDCMKRNCGENSWRLRWLLCNVASSNNNLGSCSWHVFVHISGTRKFIFAPRKRLDKILNIFNRRSIRHYSL